MAAGRILVVDDDDAIRACVGQLLREEGYEVLSAANGAEALSLLASVDGADGDGAGQPDLILLDMHMPALDGWGFAREYRLRPGPHAPILVMTAAPDAAQRAAEVDAAAVLPKPFDFDLALETVQRCIARPPHHERGVRRAAEGEGAGGGDHGGGAGGGSLDGESGGDLGGAVEAD